MTFLLAGDIGGTKTILRLAEAIAGDSSAPKTLHQATYSSQAYDDLVPMVREFLENAPGKPTRACFAIAGPVVNNTSTLTNLSWSLTGDRLQDELSLDRVWLINDFEAVGYGILGLEDDDVKVLQAGEPDPSAPIAIIGAGTGLGQGFVIPVGDSYRVFASEGGHTDFAPRNELEFELLNYLIDVQQLPRVSVERVVSGMGIASIYQFLAQKNGDRNEEILNASDKGAAIASAALENRDRTCRQALELFVDAYGAEAGNVALKFLPYGGLYVAGGIAAKILPLIVEGDRFLKTYRYKGRVSPVLDKVSVQVVLNPQVGLLGAAIRATRDT